VQQLRMLARALRVRFRAEVAQGRFEDATRTAQTMFALSRHLGQHITFVGNLVGIAVAGLATAPLEEMIGRPGCPNLYWALSYLPSPLVPISTGAQGERMWLEPTFRDLSSTTPMSEKELERVIAYFEMVLEGDKYLKEGSVRGWLDARDKEPGLMDAARRRLVEGGIPREAASRFPADQVLLLDQKRACEERHDEIIKLVYLPAWEVDALAEDIALQGRVLFDLAPAIVNVRWAQARLDQQIALLRHVEALRLYAAEQGKLPEKLAEISVPLPVDPFNGQPFRYELKGATAHLRGTAPKSHENDPPFNLHYEVTLRQ
ncbi:MAG: hypothetical protein ACREHD_28415, partial [Pirellulales bacterium]